VTAQTMDTVVLRMAEPKDAEALRRVAGRDSAAIPAAPQLLAEAGGELVAAISLVDGARIADPFRPTAGLVELLVARAAQLDDDGRPRGHANLMECPKATPSIEPLAA
jgi:hypothetical protein